MGRVYDIDPKAPHAKFFEFDPRDVPVVEKKAEEPSADMKAEAARLKAENAQLKAGK